MRKKQGKIRSTKEANRYRRKLSIRKIVIGTTEKPRVCVSRTNKHIFAQVIDDTLGKTIVTSQTFGKNAVQGATNNIDGGKLVGEDLATKLEKNNIKNIVFDRSGYIYTGVVAAVADGMREKGIRI